MHRMYGDPAPMELSSRFSAVNSIDVTEKAARSKSAPPVPWDEICSRSKVQQMRVSSSYGKGNNNPINTNSDTSSSTHGYNNSSSDDGTTMSDSPDEREDPDDVFRDQDSKSFFEGNAAGGEYATSCFLQRKSSTEQENTANNSVSGNKICCSSQDLNKSSSAPLPKEETHSQESGGVILLRPNPVKTVPPVVQGVVRGGVVAPAPRLVTASFTTAALHHQQQQVLPAAELIQTRQSKEVAQEPAKTNLSQGEAWCQKAGERNRKEKEEKEKRKLAELRRRQEIQCSFPNSYSNMGPESGRASAESDINGRGEDRGRVSPNRSRQGDNASRQQQQPQYPRYSSVRSSSSSIPPALRNDRRLMNEVEGGPRSIQSTPVFERLVTDEVRELQVYARMVENQNVELDRMRRYQEDLEKRLQDESRQHEQLEATLEARERDWRMRFEGLESEITRLNNVIKAEENKNKLLLDQIRKKDQDIQGMLKKKVRAEEVFLKISLDYSARSFNDAVFVCFSVVQYDTEVPNARPSRPIRGTQEQRVDRSIHPKVPEAKVSGGDLHRSPDEFLRQLGSAEKVRERNAR